MQLKYLTNILVFCVIYVTSITLVILLRYCNRVLPGFDAILTQYSKTLNLIIKKQDKKKEKKI